MALVWKTDKNGDELHDGDEYVGCIYPRDPYGGSQKGWRVLDANFDKVIDVVPDSFDLFGDTRKKARAFLEGARAPLPTAEELLNSTREKEQQ